MSPPSEKVTGHVPRVPHQIAPMLPMTSGLWKSTRWSWLACKCLYTEEPSDVRCPCIRFIKLRCVCPMYEAPHEQVRFYTTLKRLSRPKACRYLIENQLCWSLMEKKYAKASKLVLN